MSIGVFAFFFEIFFSPEGIMLSEEISWLSVEGVTPFPAAAPSSSAEDDGILS